jgi:molecular chaperone IbpA
MASGIPNYSPTSTWPHEQFSKYPKGLPEPSPKLMTLQQLMSDQFFLGFDEQIKRWNSLTSTKVVTFPPYNLIKSDDDHYTVELAVAGYSKEDIEITVEKDLLTVKSIATEEKAAGAVLHRGIAKRQWVQKFVLGEWFSIKGATLVDGLLTIKVEREVPEELKPKVIKIK